MTETQKETRIAVRVKPDLASGLQAIANRRFEGQLSMAAREAFRLLIDRDEAERAHAEEATAA
jgi:predicted transcriptional regulator